VGCGSAKVTNGTGGAGVRSPINDLVVSLTGYSMRQFNAAAFDAKGVYVKQCMESAGFSVIASELPSSSVLDNSTAPSEFGGMAAQAVAALSSPVTTAVPRPAASSPERTQHLNQCYDESRTKILDPLESFRAWISSQGADLLDRTLSDRKFLTLQSEELACLHKLGYGNVTSVSDLSTVFVSKVSAILEQFAKSTDRATELTKLKAVQAEEDRLTPSVLRCNSAVASRRNELREQFETEFVNRFGDGIREHLKNIRLDQVLPYLPKRDSAKLP
jgi:hypothetical protein